MKLLVLHAWLRGNIGDETITVRLLHAIRQRHPNAEITVVSVPADNPQSLPSNLIDRFFRQNVQNDVEQEIRRADAVIIAPGGGLQKPGDFRAKFIYRDLRTAQRLGKLSILSGHSICPELADLSVLRKTICVMRDWHSAEFLQRNSVPNVVRAADYGFLELVHSTLKQDTVLLFLRHDHYGDVHIDLINRKLITDGTTTELPEGHIVLSSTDRDRDSAHLQALSTRCGIRYFPLRSKDEALSRISEARWVISDRYHPAVFSKVAGTSRIFLPQGIFRDRSLVTELNYPMEGLRELAAEGLAAVVNAIA